VKSAATNRIAGKPASRGGLNAVASFFEGA
jgi:hypothetical protein